MHQFPDLHWLKNQIDQGFCNKQGWGNHRLDTTGFPSVIIHTHSEECFRPDIKGPISLFLNIRGESRCSVDGQTRLIKEDTFFITNRSQPYTLEIEKTRSLPKTPHLKKSRPTETFNIHFGENFAESVLNALLTPADRILDKGDEQDISFFRFFNQLHRRDPHFDTMISRMLHTDQHDGFDKLLFEQQLTDLLAYLLLQHREVTNVVNRLSPIRQNTRVELYKRLSHSLDYIHTCIGEKIQLDHLARISCLSKYHFLRLFKLAHGSSPYQYIQDLRLQKARDWLSHTQLPVADLAYALGFENPQSFSRLFFQRSGFYPSHYREQTK